jgi:hypothetical protein
LNKGSNKTSTERELLFRQAVALNDPNDCC